jgi:hypothetical protein
MVKKRYARLIFQAKEIFSVLWIGWLVELPFAKQGLRNLAEAFQFLKKGDVGLILGTISRMACPPTSR